ncbi:TlpA family protein disulfide reductase [Haliscomenobacter sp.]|uniref:TlpA family protein disulfide reductase n=1 Tax=Haliscomenobacter sp. TaxID=2717303 RepID=UPI003BA983E5
MHNRLDLSLLRVGSPLPDWSLEKIFEEEPPQKEAFLGKPLLILFFSLGCPGCLGRAIPYANRIVYELGDQIQVLGIHTNFESLDISTEKFAKAQEEFAIRFPFFKDKNYDTTFLNYGAGGTPHWILVDKDNVVVYSIFGSDPNNALLRLELKMRELGQISFAE